MRQIRKEKTEAVTDSAQRAKIGQIQDLSDHQQYEDVLTREQALVAGHADVEFSGFVTVTAASPRPVGGGGGADRTGGCPGELRDPGPLRAPGPGVRGRRPSPGPFGDVSDPSFAPIRGVRNVVEQAVTEKEDGPTILAGQRGFGTSAVADGGQTFGASLFTPADLARRDRRHQEKLARSVEVAQRTALLELRRREIDAVKAEQRGAAYLPRGGETGAQALRSYRRLKVPPHRATTDVLAGAYPFLAEAGLGSDGVFIGSDSWSSAAFVYDPWTLYEQGVLTNPNQLLAGVIGKGKSMLAKSLATRSIAFGRKVYVPGDPKGEWSVVCRAVGGQVIELGGTLSDPAQPSRRGPAAGRYRRCHLEGRDGEAAAGPVGLIDRIGSRTVLCARPSTPPSTPRWRPP